MTVFDSLTTSVGQALREHEAAAFAHNVGDELVIASRGSLAPQARILAGTQMLTITDAMRATPTNVWYQMLEMFVK